MKLSLAETRDGEKKRTDEIDEQERERDACVGSLGNWFLARTSSKNRRKRGKGFTEMVI